MNTPLPVHESVSDNPIESQDIPALVSLLLLPPSLPGLVELGQLATPHKTAGIGSLNRSKTIPSCSPWK